MTEKPKTKKSVTSEEYVITMRVSKQERALIKARRSKAARP